MDFYKRLKRLTESSVLLEYNRKDLRNFAGDEYAAKFFNLRDKLQAPENDLGHWIKKDDVEAFKKFIDDWESGATKSKTQKKKEERIAGADLVFNDKGWKVYHVTTYDAAKQLGSGTTWCITGRYRGYETRGKQYFDSYIRGYHLDGGYYFIFDTLNKDPNTNDYLKYCAGITDNNRLVFLYNGMQDQEISSKGIPNIPQERRVQPFKDKGITLNYFDIFTIEDGVLKKVSKRDLIAEVTIPEGVEVIYRSVFEDANHIYHVTFPSTLKEIKQAAFTSCRCLTSVELPANVEKIGTGAFIDCVTLQNLDLSETKISVIPNFLCMGCETLKTVSLPAGITAIGDDAFGYCDNVELYTPDHNEVVINYAKQKHLYCLDSETNEILVKR